MECFMENDTKDNDPSGTENTGSLILGDFFEQARLAFGLDPATGDPADTSGQ